VSRDIPSAFAGNAGEFFVLAELTRRGWTAALTARNNRDYDILATRGDGFANIRVKAKTSAFASFALFQWNAKANGGIFLDMKERHDFCVLVDIPDDSEGSPTYYVVPTTVIDKWLRDDFTKETLNKPVSLRCCVFSHPSASVRIRISSVAARFGWLVISNLRSGAMLVRAAAASFAADTGSPARTPQTVGWHSSSVLGNATSQIRTSASSPQTRAPLSSAPHTKGRGNYWIRAAGPSRRVY
jgi:hypothetical protein